MARHHRQHPGRVRSPELTARVSGMKRSTLLTLGGLTLASWVISRSLRSDFSFAGKVVIITGGSRGLGLTIARRLGTAGARLALFARDEDELARACAQLRELGCDAFAAPCDLLDRDQSLGAVQAVLDHFGTIDVLINNAGIIEIGPLENMQRADFEKSMQLHCWAPFDLIRQVIPHMRRTGGGRIVNISSIGGKVAVPHMAPYSMSKFALVGLSDAFRAELARDNICVTTVTPGVMRTGSHVNAKFKGDHGAEFTWFSLSAVLPLASVSAERAAAQIIAACGRGQGALIIGFPARLAIIGSAIFPSISGEVMKLINRILPTSADIDGDKAIPGHQAREAQRVPGWLTRIGDAAVARNNEV
jgi:NAD(P)-dependent dehydrogenase (short-subunit alcohol dehydrogenase family)